MASGKEQEVGVATEPTLYDPPPFLRASYYPPRCLAFLPAPNFGGGAWPERGAAEAVPDGAVGGAARRREAEQGHEGAQRVRRRRRAALAEGEPAWVGARVGVGLRVRVGARVELGLGLGLGLGLAVAL